MYTAVAIVAAVAAFSIGFASSTPLQPASDV